MKRVRKMLALLLVLATMLAALPIAALATDIEDSSEGYPVSGTLYEGENTVGMKAGEMRYYKFVPKDSKTYYIYTEGDISTAGWLYDEHWEQLDFNFWDGPDENFELKCDLIPGKTYYVGIELSSNSKSGNITVTIGHNESYLIKGTAGKNITWRVEKDETLIISGSGKMDNFVVKEGRNTTCHLPWYREDNWIKKVVIEPGITNIGDGAFWSCVDLRTIQISSSVTSIGDYAFCDCFFESFSVPKNIISIGDKAFSGCIKLSNISFSNGLKSIGKEAFFDCSKLTHVTIPDTVTSIGDYAFDRCENLKSVTIPKNVTKIGKCAFGYNWNKDPKDNITRYSIIKGFTISGYTGSAAEKYAKENNITLTSQKYNLAEAINSCPLTCV